MKLLRSFSTNQWRLLRGISQGSSILCHTCSIYLLLLRYPQFRKEMSYSLGQEKDHLSQQFEKRLNAEISSATGADKIVLLDFKEGLHQTVLYDIKTYKGF